jgi:DNA-binding LacI/PurR family transcriptional regulator
VNEVTIKEIAKLAGVSVSSVSRVINNKPGVNPTAREKIEKLLKEVDYKPNLTARGLVTGKTYTIGILVPRFVSYYTDQIDAILDICNQNDYSVLVSTSYDSMTSEVDSLKMFMNKKVDGILYFGSDLNEEKSALVKLIQETTPIVLVEQELDNDTPSVIPDMYNGARLLVEHLIDNNHKKIALIGPPDYDRVGLQRLEAYRDVLTENGINDFDQYVSLSNYGFEHGMNSMKEIYNRVEEKPTAVFAADDEMAIGAMSFLQSIGLKIPEDISIVGMNDSMVSKYITPSLTTVNHNQSEIGSLAIEILLKLMRDEVVEEKHIRNRETLVIRDSVKKI